MSRLQNATTLDLHGKRLEAAISAVTSFLERIRRTVATSTRSRGGPSANLRLYCEIITGSGSHSSHGPILRAAVQKLLEKRGMDFSLEHGGGCFRVDALSGWDLYNPGLATDSKVTLSKEEEFQQLALACRKRNNTGANFAQAAMTNNVSSTRPRPARTVSLARSKAYTRHSSAGSDPLPSEVAVSDANVRAATKLSVGETQQHRNQGNRISQDHEREFQRAVSQSKIDVGGASKRDMEEEDLQLAYEQSIAEETQRLQLTDQQYEDALMLAIEQSADDVKHDEYDAEDDIQQALAQSRALAEAEPLGMINAVCQLAEPVPFTKSETKKEINNDDYETQYDLIEKALAASRASTKSEPIKETSNGECQSEDFHLEQALAASRALAAAEPIKEISNGECQSEGDLIEQALAASRALAESESTSKVSADGKSEDDLIAQALAASRALAEAEPTTIPEDDLIEQALAASRALAEAEQEKPSEEDLFEKALAESMLAEERRKAYEEEFSQGANAISQKEEEDTLQEVMRLSLLQEEEEMIDEEEEMMRAIEMSKQLR